MENVNNYNKHDQIQNEILEACRILNVDARKEYRGKGWRADVYVANGEKPIAFEIQLSPQTLRKTLERQAKYMQDGITGCWFFEKPLSKFSEERPDLPLFYVERDENQNLLVNLGSRRKIELREFLLNFIAEKIQFRPSTKTNKNQKVDFVFFEMDCWKCKRKNHLYYIDNAFASACNVKIKPDEALWESTNMEYLPEIVSAAKNLAEKMNFKLGEIKHRHSHTVGKEYVSFGCYSCDSIFGDFYVFEAKIDLIYDPDKTIYSEEIELDREFTIAHLPHWCFPANGEFCN